MNFPLSVFHAEITHKYLASSPTKHLPSDFLNAISKYFFASSVFPDSHNTFPTHISRSIKTPEQAQNASVRYLASYNAVSKALGLGRGLAEIEKKYVDHWQNDWNMDLSVILEACNRTVLKLHHADFKYTEGILSHWNEQNVRTLQGVEQSDLHYAQTKEQKEKKKPSTSGKQPPRNQLIMAGIRILYTNTREDSA